MRDPYEVLGVARSAGDSEIKAAFRELAKRYHPDTSDGDAKSEERFRGINGAYSILKDKSTRAAYDRGDIDASGAPTRRSYRGRSPYEGASAPQGAQPGAEHFKFAFGGEDNFRPQEFFSDLFGSKGPQARQPRSTKKRGADINYKLKVSFLEAIKGGKRRVRLPNGAKLDVKVPAGVADAQQIRLKGQGEAGTGGAGSGDVRITISVEPHEAFTRDGDNIRLTLPLTVDEAIKGAKISVPTVWGSVTMSIPPGSNSGGVLRLRGKGSPKSGDARGDQLVTLSVVLPSKDADFDKLVSKWANKNSYDVRDHLKGL